METYAKRSEPTARPISARAGHGQPDMATVLQAYRNRTAQFAALTDKDDELVQGKLTAQLQEEEEETLQGKIVAQLQNDEEEETLQGKFVTQLQGFDEEEPLQQKAENRTGLPDRIKNGVESLSGYSLDAVKVYKNSPKPAQLQAYAYTQGTDIHVAPGQERYLGHEAWHVVQQMQGRVQPTTQLQGVAVNDNEGLEREADVMGERAVKLNDVTHESSILVNVNKKNSGLTITQRQAMLGLPQTPALDQQGTPLVPSPLTPQESVAINQAFNNATPVQLLVLSTICQRILLNLGVETLIEFYRGAHIVFQDSGNFYMDLLNMGAGSLMERRTTTRQTSHYSQKDNYDVSIEDNMPQQGLDLFKGHILFGVIPNRMGPLNPLSGNTFVQTEMFGFQNIWARLGHLWGWLVSRPNGAMYGAVAGGVIGGIVGKCTGDTQKGINTGMLLGGTLGGDIITGENSGLVGYSGHAERFGNEIAEQNNAIVQLKH